MEYYYDWSQWTPEQVSFFWAVVLLALSICLLILFILVFWKIITHPNEFEQIIRRIEKFFRGR